MISRVTSRTESDHGDRLSTQIRPYEELALLSGKDGEVTLPQEGKMATHQARHEFHDTRHHAVDYRLRASTRFREYFAPALLTASAIRNPLDDGQSVIAPDGASARFHRRHRPPHRWCIR